MTEVTPARQLDCRGMMCPLPVQQTAMAMDQMHSGQILEVLGTDPAAREELEEFARREGHHFIGLEDDKDFTRYLIRVK